METFKRRLKFRDTWYFKPDKTGMAEQLKKKKRTRAGHKVYVAKIQPKVEACIDDFRSDRTQRIIQLRTSLEEQLEALRTLDKEILELLEENEDVGEDEIASRDRGKLQPQSRNKNEDLGDPRTASAETSTSKSTTSPKAIRSSLTTEECKSETTETRSEKV